MHTVSIEIQRNRMYLRFTDLPPIFWHQVNRTNERRNGKCCLLFNYIWWLDLNNVFTPSAYFCSFNSHTPVRFVCFYFGNKYYVYFIVMNMLRMHFWRRFHFPFWLFSLFSIEFNIIYFTQLELPIWNQRS